MIKSIISKILGDSNKKALKKIQPLVGEINKIEEEYCQTIKDQNAVLAKTTEFKNRLKNGETLEKILPEAFALVKTACRQLQGTTKAVRGKEVTWNMIPYDVQLLGGIVLHQGNIAEMKTGEGKTLVCTLAVYLNALTERGVYVVTVNEYLAQRDAEWMEILYNYLGLSVGTIVSDMDQIAKKAAYNCDITYGTNNEFGFDYLRDNMTTDPERIVQRELNYAIVDEVDSILIDEARTPLIISAPAEESTEKYQRYSALIPQLKENSHFLIDEKQKQATLTEEGIAKMEQLLGVENIYTESGFTEVHHIEQALRAHACYRKDVDYIIQDDQIVIIDEFTGRLMAGRRYGQGLHQAIKAKERVEVKRESKTLATVSFQNYFRLFKKLAGMTGTAKTEEEEFYQIYGLETLVIPTNRDLAREDRPDVIFKNQKGKFIAIGKLIKEISKTGQPILVGTVSVEKSEMLSELLKIEGVKHSVLNAKNHQGEAEIVEKAGQKNAVTISTNMAGRGTDIKLGEGVKELGGLYVMGTERHESRRIDNQLRGRSGRQGDPGKTQFYVSMEDDLMRKFGGDRMLSMMNALKVPDDMPIETRLISRSIESAQKKVEGHNFDIRKHLVEYDDVMNIHRNVIYTQRRKILDKEEIKEDLDQMLDQLAEELVRNFTEARPEKEWDYQGIHDHISNIHKENNFTTEKLSTIKNQKELIEYCQNYFKDNYNHLEKTLPEAELMRKIEKAVYLRTNDRLWMDHIDAMSKLRGIVAFSGYAQKDPLTEYKSQAYDMFMEMLGLIRGGTITTLFKMDLSKVVPQEMLQKAEVKVTEARHPGDREGSVTRSTFIPTSQPQQIRKAAPVDSAKRNEPCPCGSGKKHKKCCGQ